MPPKKTQSKNAKKTSNFKEDLDEVNGKEDFNPKDQPKDSQNEETVPAGQKRKDPPQSKENDEPPTKATKKDPSFSSPTSLIRFLLSPKALELYQNPKTDPQFPSSEAKIEKDYYTSTLTPFEHLVCAVILSRPISHVLGQRTIKTVLNEPWDFGDVEKILEAGKENEDGKTKRVEAMEEAKTQHRQKTASELGGLAKVVKDEGWDKGGDGGLRGLLEGVGKEDVQAELRRLLTEKVKGLGGTGVDIFMRRVQGCEGWEGIGWFVDRKTKGALEELGLPGEGQELKKCVEGSGVEDVRRSFVVILERALGILLEGKQKEVRGKME